MSNQKSANSDTSMPISVKKLLWEYNPNEIDPIKHRDTIIERVLDHGSQTDVQWLFKHVPRKDIEETIRNSNNLDPKTSRFWSLKLSLEPCTPKRSPHRPNKAWKY